MITLNTLIELKKRLPKEAWSWAFMALRQDDVVWNSLSEAAFARRALDSLGANPARWSPASLALLALGEQIRLEELCATPIRPLAQPLRSRAIRAYEAWLKTSDDVISLAHAGLLALSLRERRRLKGSWDGIAVELRSPESLSKKAAARRAAQTIVACLYGMVPDSFDLLRAICTSANNLAQPRLALHALFCTPMSPKEQVEVLQKLLAELPHPQRQALLRDLAALRPWLAAQLTRDYLQNTPLENEVPDLEANPDKQGELIASLMQQAELRRIASQPEQEAELLERSVQAAQHLQGYALGRLGQAIWQASLVAGNGDQAKRREASLETWGQAVELAPDSPDHPARLARALMEIGRQDEAQSLLENWLEGDRLLSHPALALVTAMLAEEQGDTEAVQTAAGAALKLVETGQPLDQEGYILLAQLLLQAELAEQSAQAACLGLERYPLNRDLLELRAQAGYALGEPDQTLGDAYLVMAIEQSAKTQNGLEASSTVGRGDFFRKPWQLGARRGLRRLLVESLEAAGEWHEALDERLVMMDETPSPTAEDWHELANCALKAGKPDQAMTACRKALQLNANDDQAHRVLGEAALETGDLNTALEHLHQAVRLAPQQADLWLALAGAHRKAGQVTQMLDVLRAASLAAPENAQIHLALGQAYLDQKALTQALPSLQKAASLEPDNHRVGLVYGQTMSQLGHLNQAKDILKGAYKNGCGGGIEIINHDEEDELEYDVEVAYAYAKVLLALGEYREAVDILEEIVHLQPENPEPHIDLARALIKIGGSAATIETAISFLKKAIVLCIDLKHKDPSKTAYANQLQVEALTLLAEAYAALGNYPASAETYQEAMRAQEVSKVTEQSRLALGYSRVALQLGQHKEAVAALKSALEADPRNLALQRALSEAYLAGGSVQEAMQAARKVLELKPYDLDTLTWFAELGLRQQNLRGEEGGIARAEVIRTLQEATQLAPYRGDLLFNLAKLLLEDGDGPAALAALRKLAGAEDAEHPVSPDDLYQAARASRGLGDGMLAISLLRRAVEGLASDSATETGLLEAHSVAQKAAGVALPVNLYYELAMAYQQAGMLQAALEALERALELDPNRLALHLYKADLLSELQMPEQTLESLRQALRLDPANAALHHRAALLLNQLGNLSGALEHAGQAALTVDDLQDRELAHTVRLNAATLAYSMLRSQEAWVYLKEELVNNNPACQHEDHACMRVSIALDAHQPEMAAGDVAWIGAASPDQPHSLALQARLAAAQGDSAGGFEIFKSALRAWMAQAARQAEKAAPETPSAAKAGAKFSSALGLRMLCQAAQELSQWEDAITLARRLVDRLAQEPLAHMLLAQALIRRVEVQRLNLDLEVRQHALGAQALSDEARQTCEQALASAERLAAIVVDPDSGDPLPGIGDEAMQTIELWRLRGQAVFNPEPHTAQAFSRAIGAAHADPQGVAAMVMALRKAWEGDQDQRASNVAPGLNGLSGIRQSGQAQPLIQMALSLEKADPRRALEIANQALQTASQNADSAGVQRNDIPQPMLQFLIARLALAAGALATAQQSIEKALAEWPDESRWRLLAAKIYQQRDASAGLPDSAKAIAHLEKAVYLEADYAPHHLALGKLYLRSGDAQRAVRSLEQAATLLPDKAEAWLELAQAQQQLGDLEQAAVSAEKAIELAAPDGSSGDPTAALLLRGDIALKANNPRGALSRVQVVLRNQPDHPEGLHLLSRTLEALNRPAEALAALDRAMQRMEDPFPLQVARVQLLRRAQGPEAALLAMEDMTQRYPQQIVLQALMAEMSFEAGRDEAGVQAAQQALQSGDGQLSLENQARLHYLVGLNMRKQGQLDAAVHHMSQAIQLAPDGLDAYLELGQIHQERREYKQALKVYQKAMSVAPKDYRPYYQSGQVLKDSKDYLAAETMLRRAAQMAPDEVSIHRLLGAVVALNLVHNQKI